MESHFPQRLPLRQERAMRRCHCNVYMRVMTWDCCRRCQGKPTTRASNCCCVKVSVAPAVASRHRPQEVTRVQPTRGAPDAEAIMHQQFDAAGARVGKKVAVVRLRLAEHMHDAREQTLGTGAHVHRLDRQPQGVDADHRSNSRIQAAHSTAAAAGQVTVIAIAPRRSSTWISEGAVVDGIATETKGGRGADFGVAISGSARCSSITSRAGSPASLIQRLARLALTP